MSRKKRHQKYYEHAQDLLYIHGYRFLPDTSLGYQSSISGNIPPTPIANCIPVVEKEIHHHLSHQIQYYYNITIHHESETIPLTMVSWQEILSGKWLHKELGLSYIIDDLKHFTRCIQLQIASLHPKIQYGFMGWEGCTFLAPGENICGDSKADCKLDDPQFAFEYNPDLNSVDAGKYVVETMFKVTRSQEIATMISFLLLSNFLSILNRIGKSPTFILTLVGMTGTRKTSSAKAVFNIFHKDKDHVHSKADSTVAGLEYLMKQFRDTVMYTDDIAPTTSSNHAATMARTLEMLIRATGDKVGRTKVVGNIGTSQSPKCLIAITAEQIDLGSSSMARLFPIHFNKKTVNLAKLTEVQNTPLNFPSAIRHYLTYHSTQLDTFSRELVQVFEKKRGELQRRVPDVHGRYIESCAWLFASHNFYIRYLKDIGAIKKKEAERFIQDYDNYLNDWLQNTSITIKNDTPAENFRRALRVLKEINAITLSNVSKVNRSNITESPTTPKTVGYVFGKESSDCDLYLIPDQAIRAVRSYYRNIGKNFNFTTDTITAHLLSEKALNISKAQRGEYRTKKIINGDRDYYWRINYGWLLEERSDDTAYSHPDIQTFSQNPLL